MANVDIELKKAFQELQTKMIETTVKLKHCDKQIEQQKNTIRHSQLTAGQVKDLPDVTRLYQSVGRMFVLKPRDGVMAHLHNKASTAEDRIKTLKTNMEYLQRSVTESESNLREMVAAKKAR